MKAGLGSRIRAGGERGSGTIWVVAFMSVIWLVGMTGVVAGGVRGARQRGDAAADLAALAGAVHVLEGVGPACARARGIAAESGVRVSACSVRGTVVEVTVTSVVDVPFGVGRVRLDSRARAGPAGPDGVPWPDATR